MPSKTLLSCIVFGLIALCVQPMTAASTPPTLAGSWQFTLTPTTPPTPPVVQIPGLATFTPEGSVIETDGTELVPIPSSSGQPLAATPGHGVWEPAPVPGALYVQYFSILVQPDGALYARNITQMTVTLNTTGNGFSGAYTTTQVAGGATRIIAQGTVSGQLIPRNPLP